MKHKKSGIFKRTAISVMAAVCALSSATALSANAASYTREDILPSNGYVVGTTAAYSDTTATCTGKIVSGPSTSIEVSGKGYFGSKADLIVKTLNPQKKSNTQKYSRNITNAKKAIGCRCTVTYCGSYTYKAKTGTVTAN